MISIYFPINQFGLKQVPSPLKCSKESAHWESCLLLFPGQKEVLPTALLGCCKQAIEGVMMEVSISFSLLLHSFLEILVIKFPKHH